MSDDIFKLYQSIAKNNQVYIGNILKYSQVKKLQLKKKKIAFC